RPRESSLALATEDEVPDTLRIDRLTRSGQAAEAALLAAGIRIYADGEEVSRLPGGPPPIVICPLPDGSPADSAAGPVCIDPELGRLFVRDETEAARVWSADFAYGFPGRLGGGP